jgi:hypothetical protein
MLNVARVRAGGAQISWIERHARALRLGRRFDFIMLTGHVFQILLIEADQRAVLARATYAFTVVLKDRRFDLS